MGHGDRDSECSIEPLACGCCPSLPPPLPEDLVVVHGCKLTARRDGGHAVLDATHLFSPIDDEVVREDHFERALDIPLQQ